MAFDTFSGAEANQAKGPEKVSATQQLKEAVEKDASLLEEVQKYPKDIKAESYAEVMQHYVERGQGPQAEILKGFAKDLGVEDFDIANHADVAHPDEILEMI